jgi:hypothetical protein
MSQPICYLEAQPQHGAFVLELAPGMNAIERGVGSTCSLKRVWSRGAAGVSEEGHLPQEDGDRRLDPEDARAEGEGVEAVRFEQVRLEGDPAAIRPDGQHHPARGGHARGGEWLARGRVGEESK